MWLQLWAEEDTEEARRLAGDGSLSPDGRDQQFGLNSKTMGNHWRVFSREGAMTAPVFSKDHSGNCRTAALQVFRQRASLLSLHSEVKATCLLTLGEESRGADGEKREGKE